MNLGERLKKLRVANKLSQDELADALHVTRQAVSRWENDRDAPSLMTIIKLAELYEMSLEEFFKESDFETAKKIDKAVKKSVIYQRAIIGMGITVIGVLGIFSIGRYYHIDWIDRFNPFIPTQLSYAIAPKKTPMDKKTNTPKQVHVWATSGPFGDAYHSQWVTISIGAIPVKGYNYVVMERKGSYVSRAVLIKRGQIPKLTARNIDTKYRPEQKDMAWTDRHWNPFY